MTNDQTCARCGATTWAGDQFCSRCGSQTWGAPAPFGSTPQQTAPQPPDDRPRRRGLQILGVVAVVALIGVAAVGGAVLHGRQTAAPPTTTPPAPTSTTATAATTTAAATTAPATDFAALYSDVASGVVRIETVGCTETGIGSGFLISPVLVATVNHVVADSAVVSLIVGTQRTTGTVIGTDPATDLALVRSSRPLTGHAFPLATTPPGIGTSVAAIGFPVGDPITLTRGTISGVDRNITIGSTTLTGLIETDTPINPGNSGGPLLTMDGAVAGLVDAQRTDATGIGYAVTAATASSRFPGWTANPQPQPGVSCSNPLGPQQQANPDVGNAGLGALSPDQSNGVLAALNTYFGGINSGNYAAAFATLSARLRAGASSERFATGTATSYDSDVQVLGARAMDTNTVVLELQFSSIQATDKGPDGDTCDVWHLDYRMVDEGGATWFIDSTTAHDGAPTHTSCG